VRKGRDGREGEGREGVGRGRDGRGREGRGWGRGGVRACPPPYT